MTGYRSSDLRHNCEQNGCFQANLPSWDWMRGCFPRGIMPTDVDGMVEIRGSVLFIEQKRPGASLSNGQRIALKTLAAKDRTTVLCLRSTLDGAYECIVFDGTPPTGWRHCTREQVQAWLSHWAETAERRAA